MLCWCPTQVHKQTVSANVTTEQALMDSTKEELLDELARRMGASSSTDAIERLASSVGYVKVCPFPSSRQRHVSAPLDLSLTHPVMSRWMFSVCSGRAG